MLHNLDPATSLTISGVLWTLAVEEQLYLAYFLLLALRGRVGWFATLAICLATRVGWFGLAFVVHRTLGIEIVVQEAAAAHWFVWALGAWSVEAWFGLVSRPRWVSSLWLSGLCLLGAAGLAFASNAAPQGSGVHDLIWLLNDPLWGLGFFVLVNRVTMEESGEKPAARRPNPWLSLVAATGLRKVGLFSYSLYLTHELVLTHLHQALSARFVIDEPTAAMFRLFVLSPIAVAFAWVFFLSFERPFLSRSRQGAGRGFRNQGRPGVHSG
jgi:peptidoglycan/LPS O-acetylase OafA/YrhL